MKRLVVVLVACSSPAGERTTTPVVTAPADAAVALDAPPDAGPSPELAAAPEWVFRFDAPDRKETWRLRFTGDAAMLSIDRKPAPVTYLGTATGTSFAFPAGKLELACSHAKLDVGCEKKRTKLDVLSCKLAGFDVPMPFAAAPGIEFVADKTCYRTIDTGR